MFKTCSRCGKIHDSNYRCTKGKVYKNYDSEERKLRHSHQWTQKSLEIREHANWLCEVCRDQGRLNYENLEVHHIIKVKEDKTKLLDNFNLVCLCVTHHKLADEGYIDSDYLLTLAKRREKKQSPCLLTSFESESK